MIAKQKEIHRSNVPCVYIAIGKEHYLRTDIDRVRLKIGLSRSMGNRRRALRADSRYYAETIYEYDLPVTYNRWLESIEADLHVWLHNAPTALHKGGEEDEVDYHIAELLIARFPQMASAIAKQYHITEGA